jgi:hypothetical protein
MSSDGFLARQKEFKNDWSDAKRNLFMERLCTVASQRPILGVGAAISQSDWEGGLSKSLRDEWKHPYYFCIYGMLSLIRTKVLRDRSSSLPVPLFFLFDDKPKFEGAARTLYREYQSSYDPKEQIFGGMDFGSRKKYKPLQIADLLVGVINKRFEEMTQAVDPELSKIKQLDLLFKKEIAISFPTAELLRQFPEFARRGGLRA